MHEPRDWSALDGAVHPLDGTGRPEAPPSPEAGEQRDVAAEVQRLRRMLAGAPQQPDAAARPDTAPRPDAAGRPDIAPRPDAFAEAGPMPDFLGDHVVGAEWAAEPGVGAAARGGGRKSGERRKKAAARPPVWARDPVVYSSDEAAEAAARNVVLHRLSARQHSRAELEKRLAAKDIPEAVGRRVLDRFTEVGLVDDAAFAAAWVEQRARTKGLSRSALRRELAGKGVAGEDAEPALEIVDDDTEIQAARDMVRKKLQGSTSRLDRDKALRRLSGMLARRGYGSAVALRVVHEEWERLHDDGQ